MSHLAILPILIPLLAGALLLIAGRYGKGVERAIGVAATAALLPVALLLLLRAAGGETQVYYLAIGPRPTVSCWSRTA